MTFAQLHKGGFRHFRSLIYDFSDKHIGSNTRYAIEDAGLGAFSGFFTQIPSFLSFQKGVEKINSLFYENNWLKYKKHL